VLARALLQTTGEAVLPTTLAAALPAQRGPSASGDLRSSAPLRG
jgi:hypothetical protein